MACHMGQPDEFLLISGEASVAWWERAAEEGYGIVASMEHCPNARAGGIALDDEACGQI